MKKYIKHWEKTTPYGDWRETSDRKNSRTNRVTHILREAKTLGVAGKHVGSKPLERLLQGIAKAHKASVEESTKIEESTKTEESTI